MGLKKPEEEEEKKKKKSRETIKMKGESKQNRAMNRIIQSVLLLAGFGLGTTGASSVMCVRPECREHSMPAHKDFFPYCCGRCKDNIRWTHGWDMGTNLPRPVDHCNKMTTPGVSKDKWCTMYNYANRYLATSSVVKTTPEPLAAGWMSKVDPTSGKTYYHHKTYPNTSQWVKPITCARKGCLFLPHRNDPGKTRQGTIRKKYCCWYCNPSSKKGPGHHFKDPTKRGTWCTQYEF